MPVPAIALVPVSVKKFFVVPLSLARASVLLSVPAATCSPSVVASLPKIPRTALGTAPIPGKPNPAKVA